ncbi:MAG: beta-lactamase family protein, partial [Gemmatimonadetes bacterium]|nr:beta-lactamase family protein [Gemmatimonadota bacterium]
MGGRPGPHRRGANHRTPPGAHPAHVPARRGAGSGRHPATVSRTALLLAFAGLAACAPAGPEPAAPAQAPRWTEVSRYLDSVIADGVAPGAVLGVSYRGCHSYHGSGRLGLDDGTRPDSATIYDLASLTKVVGLTTVTMLAVERGAIALDSPVVRYVPAFANGAVTVRHLLTHSSGLP